MNNRQIYYFNYFLRFLSFPIFTFLFTTQKTKLCKLKIKLAVKLQR
jgi:hypothetical protein